MYYKLGLDSDLIRICSEFGWILSEQNCSDLLVLLRSAQICSDNFQVVWLAMGGK